MDGFLAAVNKQRGTSGLAPASLTQQRLTQSLFDQWSTDNTTLTEQNFIDAWYTELQSVGGPYPNNTDLVVEYYDRIAAWAGFCDDGIPYSNTADYVSSVGPAAFITSLMCLCFSINSLQLFRAPRPLERVIAMRF